MGEINFLGKLHNATKRNYVDRVISHDKPTCAEIARRWGYDYWDGERQFGYGGYKYDGRWRIVAEDMAIRYNLKSGDRILDIGCGKAFLLYEFTQVVPGIEVAGIDISEYGIANAKPEVEAHLQVGDCTTLPFHNNSFELPFSFLK